MESNAPSENSKWSLAARDGLILAAVTVVISTLTFLTQNSFLSTLLWLVKLGGSIWVLNKITNHSLTGFATTECEFVQVQDTDNYLIGQL